MTNKTDGERLVALETKVSLMADDVSYIKTIMEEVRLSLPTYATKTELKSEIDNLRKAHTLQTWLVGCLGTTLGIILGVLIQYYFSK